MRSLMLSALIIMWVAMGCDENTDDKQDARDAKINEVANRAINGQQWRVTTYAQDGDDHTANFNGYIFEFDGSNLLTVTNGSDNFAGNWTVTADNSNDDDQADFNDIDFNILFTNPRMFQGLTEDWNVLSISESKIELTHARGDGGSDHLTFERI